MRDDKELVESFLGPIRECAEYRPAFGHSDSAGVDLQGFLDLYGGDLFYAWIGLDTPLVYAAHKAAGGLTSVYRQIGVGTERLLRDIMKDALGLSSEQTSWKYEYSKGGGKKGVHVLDAKIAFDDLAESRRTVFREWLSSTGPIVGLSNKKRERIEGVVFEIRQGYKSADSKRQNADVRFGMSAYQEGLLPTLLILSRQVSETVVERYRRDNMAVLTGTLADDARTSTFAFFKHVVGYDLVAFFERNSVAIKCEVRKIVQGLLGADQ
ncbi:MAG: hypothetical protein GX615_07185 [Lentisphaerae bacterium]|nr:hypothetical protein [Lentisphaerota bacterium]